MIENILASKVNIRIIRLLLTYPNKDFSAGEIEKYTESKGGNLHRALRKLSIYELIIKEKNAYKINYSNQLVQTLNTIFEKEKKYFQNIDQKELNILSEFTNELFKKYSDIKEIILFGSVARGMYSEKSDIDIMIIKEKMNTKTELETTKLAKKYKKKIQFFIHTPKEFKESKEPMMKEAKKEGISLTRTFSNLKYGEKQFGLDEF